MFAMFDVCCCFLGKNKGKPTYDKLSMDTTNTIIGMRTNLLPFMEELKAANKNVEFELEGDNARALGFYS